MGGTERLGAVLTAAGLSSRMGEFKPLLPVGDLPLLEHGLRALRAGGVESLFVVTGHRAAGLRPLLARWGAEEVHNPDYAHTDMFASVRLGLARAAAADCGRVFFLPGDVALFRPHTVREMAGTSAGLVRPSFRGRTGHPVLLDRHCLFHILAHDGTTGLRGALESFFGPKLTLALPDPGVLMDADTPEDYRRLLQYHEDSPFPDRALCMDVLSWFGTPSEAAAHCEAVAEAALTLARGLNAAGRALNLRLVEAGALLHDLAKGRPRHSEAAAKLLRALDCPAVAAVVEAHMTLPSGAADLLDERAVVYYADKIIQGTRRVTLEERFTPIQARLAGDSAALAAAGERLNTARRVGRWLRATLAAAPHQAARAALDLLN